MNIKQILIAATPIITAVAGYYGYQPIQELKSPPTVEVEVNVPDNSPQQHTHKDWKDYIKQELEKARAEHNEIHH